MNLYWRDTKLNDYKIANLSKKYDTYILKIYEDGLKNAIKHGCIGMGNIDFLTTEYQSKELFSFFAERIPSKDHPRIEKILKEYNLSEYDEMKLLEVTHGILYRDRYYIK